MGLVGNFTRNNGQAGYTIGPLGFNLGARQVPNSWANNLVQNGRAAYRYGAAMPMGYLPPNTQWAPIRLGEISFTGAGSGSASFGLLPSRAMSIDMTGSGDLAATGALVIAMAAALTGSGNLSASIEGRLNASIGMTGSGGLSASASAIGSMAASLTGSGSLSATIAAYGNMEIDIVVTGTGLTTANVGQAVWSALAVANDDPGTMGEKLNDAGSGANPWAQVIEGGFTASDILKLIAAATAGQLSGAPSGPILIKGIDGTTTRITATVDTDGNRLTVTYDVS